MRALAFEASLAIVLLSYVAGCASQSTPATHGTPADDVRALIDPTSQRRILDEHYDKSRLRAAVGSPTIDDGEEWVYVAKYEDDHGAYAGMVMAVAASLNDPAWKTVVVTFDRNGVVERIRVGSTGSAIAERQRRGILFGWFYNRDGRVRAATEPATRPRSQKGQEAIPPCGADRG